MKAKNGKKLVDMIGLDYDDEGWEALLDQLSFDDMVAFIGDSFHWTMPLESVQAPGTRDENGPQGLTASLIASDKTEMDATAFTSEDVMAATFNRDLMTEIGKVIGNNCLKAGVSILYGPGNNIHRTPYGGRRAGCQRDLSQSIPGSGRKRKCQWRHDRLHTLGMHMVRRKQTTGDRNPQRRMGM